MINIEAYGWMMNGLTMVYGRYNLDISMVVLVNGVHIEHDSQVSQNGYTPIPAWFISWKSHLELDDN